MKRENRRSYSRALTKQYIRLVIRIFSVLKENLNSGLFKVHPRVAREILSGVVAGRGEGKFPFCASDMELALDRAVLTKDVGLLGRGIILKALELAFVRLDDLVVSMRLARWCPREHLEEMLSLTSSLQRASWLNIREAKLRRKRWPPLSTGKKRSLRDAVLDTIRNAPCGSVAGLRIKLLRFAAQHGNKAAAAWLKRRGLDEESACPLGFHD